MGADVGNGGGDKGMIEAQISEEQRKFEAVLTLYEEQVMKSVCNRARLSIKTKELVTYCLDELKMWRSRAQNAEAEMRAARERKIHFVEPFEPDYTVTPANGGSVRERGK